MEIPKIIHYTWFSSNPFPDEIQSCINSWKKVLPDYQLVCWDYSAVKNIDNAFLQEALKEKKWAFASDFVRLYAVYNEGGIYLDTDVLIYKNYDPLLNNKCFIGYENSFHLVGREVCSFLSAHCFGAERNNLFIKKCLDYYTGRHFILSSNKELSNELRLDMTLLPYIQAMIAKTYGWNWSFKERKVFHHEEFVIFPSSYFDPQNPDTSSYCNHLALGSWRESRRLQKKVTLKYKVKWRLKKVLDKIFHRFSYIIIEI